MADPINTYQKFNDSCNPDPSNSNANITAQEENLNNNAPWKSNGNSTENEDQNKSNIIIAQVTDSSINKSTSQRSERVEHRLLKYKLKYEQRRKQNEELQKILKQPTQGNVPIINDVSNRIVSTKKRDKLKVEDRLIQQSILRKRQKEEQLKLEEHSRKHIKPTITKSPNQSERSINIAEHLYGQQKIIDEKKEILRSKLCEEKKYSYKPDVDSNLNKELAEKHMQRLKSKQIYQMQQEPDHKPKINKKSEQIASKMGTLEERLLNPKQRHNEQNKELLHTPIINEASEKIIAKSKKDGKITEKWNELYELSNKRQIEMEEKRKQREEEIINSERCTFQPSICSTYGLAEPVQKRVMKWAKEKESKLSIRRADEQLRQTEECTFKPAIIERSQVLQQSDDVKSYNEHIEKIKSARLVKKQQQVAEDSKAGSGKVWVNKSTVPIGFNFSQNTKEIKSLKMPVQVKEVSKNNKYHNSYPKSEIEGSQKSKTPRKRAVENVRIEVSGGIEESMNSLHKELMCLDV